MHTVSVSRRGGRVQVPRSREHTDKANYAEQESANKVLQTLLFMEVVKTAVNVVLNNSPVIGKPRI